MYDKLIFYTFLAVVLAGIFVAAAFDDTDNE